MPRELSSSKRRREMGASRDFYKDLARSKSRVVRRHFIKAYEKLWPEGIIIYTESNGNDFGIDCEIKTGNRRARTQEKVLYGDLDYDSYFFETVSHGGPGWLFNDDIFNASYLFLCRMTPDYSRSRMNVYPASSGFIGFCRKLAAGRRTIVNRVRTGAGVMLPYEALEGWEFAKFEFQRRAVR
jgi:hypothetical protein